MGKRISGMRLNGRPMQADRRYKVAGWAPVAEGAQGEPVWEVVARYLRGRRQVPPQKANRPIILS
jgi:sulfur-oxidizing protein SoxB